MYVHSAQNKRGTNGKCRQVEVDRRRSKKRGVEKNSVKKNRLPNGNRFRVGLCCCQMPALLPDVAPKHAQNWRLDCLPAITVCAAYALNLIGHHRIPGGQPAADDLRTSVIGTDFDSQESDDVMHTCHGFQFVPSRSRLHRLHAHSARSARPPRIAWP